MTKSPQQSRNAQQLAIFKSSALFGALDPASLRHVLGMARTVRLDRGQVYQSRGARVDGVVIVANGFLRISLSNSEGKRHVVRHLGPGQIFNLLPVVDGGPAIHDAEAGIDTELIVLPAESFLELQRVNPEVAAAAQRLLNARARMLYDGLADAMLLTLGQRCARSLLSVVHEFGEPAGEGGAMSVRLSQSEFAEMLGNARPVVNRALKKLQREGVIEVGYQRIVVLQPFALREAAGL
jgi:CRP/FNR family cyclic AMP-dependent transcriptional regulator